MPEGEDMFNYHGFRGRCPKPVKPKDTAEQLADLIMDADAPKRLEQAVAAERERCARIATDAQYDDDDIGPKESAWNDACRYIANDIRGQG